MLAVKTKRQVCYSVTIMKLLSMKFWNGGVTTTATLTLQQLRAGLRLPSAWFEVSSTPMDNIVVVKVAEGSPDQPVCTDCCCFFTRIRAVAERIFWTATFQRGEKRQPYTVKKQHRLTEGSKDCCSSSSPWELLKETG